MEVVKSGKMQKVKPRDERTMSRKKRRKIKKRRRSNRRKGGEIDEGKNNLLDERKDRQRTKIG